MGGSILYWHSHQVSTQTNIGNAQVSETFNLLTCIYRYGKGSATPRLRKRSIFILFDRQTNN